MSLHTPLWKQILGALGGAAVAVVLYEGFLIVSPTLQAWTSLPSAPGVEQSDARIAGNPDADELARQQQRNAEIAERFGSDSALHAAASSSSRPSGLKNVVDAAKSILHFSSSISSSSIAPVALPSSSSRQGIVPAVVTKGSVNHGEALPNSGLELWVAAAGALGATTAQWRMRKRAA